MHVHYPPGDVKIPVFLRAEGVSMARLVRADVFDPLEVSAFHCINRCVRRSFLCGQDPFSGQNFDHRKARPI